MRPAPRALAVLPALLLVVAVPAAAAPPPSAPTSQYVLQGDGPVQPENLAYDPRTRTFFTGDAGTGTVHRGSIDGTTAEVFLPATPQRQAASGVTVDAQGRLYVLTGAAGTLEVYDVATRGLLAVFDTGPGGFLNDVVVTPSGDVVVSDSLRPVLHRVRAADVLAGGVPERLETGTGVTVTPKPNGAFALNGMAVLSDTELLVAKTNTDQLFRVVLGDGTATATEVAVQGELANPDGVGLVRGRLFVVDNLGEALVELVVSSDRRRARVVGRTVDPSFRTPTDVVEAAGRLLVSNSQLFTTPQSPPYTVSSVRLPVGAVAAAEPAAAPGPAVAQLPLTGTGAPAAAGLLLVLAALGLRRPRWAAARG